MRGWPVYSTKLILWGDDQIPDDRDLVFLAWPPKFVACSDALGTRAT